MKTANCLLSTIRLSCFLELVTTVPIELPVQMLSSAYLVAKGFFDKHDY